MSFVALWAKCHVGEYISTLNSLPGSAVDLASDLGKERDGHGGRVGTYSYNYWPFRSNLIASKFIMRCLS